MSPGLAAIAAAHSSHMSTFGETVTFRGVAATALVNRLELAQSIGGKIDANLPLGSTIQLPLTVTPIPREGEVVTDRFSYRHTIKTVTPLGYAWQVKCNTNLYAG